MMKLFIHPISHNARRVVAVAKYLGLEVEMIVVDLFKGEQRQAAFQALNPFGQVPALQDGDFVLSESNAIMQYLASQKPNTLWPEDTKLRADITRWQFWQANSLASPCFGLMVELMMKPMRGGQSDEEKVKRYHDEFNRAAKMLEKHLSHHTYLVNNQLTLADFSVAADLTYADATQLPLADYPNIQAWYNRIASLPVWQETQPQLG